MGDTSYFENLDQYVCDNSQVVTFTWLSRELSVPINTAKQMLHTWAETKGNNISVVYMLGGRVADGSKTYYSLVPKEKLIEAKSKLEEITSLHVFSVQPSLPIDSATLVAPEVEIRKKLIFDTKKALDDPLVDNRYGPIRLQEPLVKIAEPSPVSESPKSSQEEKVPPKINKKEKSKLTNFFKTTDGETETTVEHKESKKRSKSKI